MHRAACRRRAAHRRSARRAARAIARRSRRRSRERRGKVRGDRVARLAAVGGQLAACRRRRPAGYRARRRRTGARSCRGSCRTPVRVGHRAADHLQHLGGGGLLLERLLGLVEQARVLDRDHRLVGEGLQQRQLLVGEGLRRLARDADRADAAALPEHRRDSMREVARGLGDARAGAAVRRRSSATSAKWTRRRSRIAAPGRCPSSGRGNVPRDARRLARPREAHRVQQAVVADQEDAELRSPRTGARSCRGSCRTPAAVSATELLITSGSRPWPSAARAPPWSR